MRSLCLALILFATFSVTAPTGAAAQDGSGSGDATIGGDAAAAGASGIEMRNRMWIAYEGELLDDLNRPISGVFPLTLSLYRSDAATEPVWVEVQHVAVLEGRYQIYLGRTRGVPAVWEGQTRVLSIELGDAGEIARHPIVLAAWDPAERDPAPQVRGVGVTELAGRAVSAERATYAQDCRALSGRTAQELDRFDALQTRINELRSALNQAGSQRVGRETVTQSRIGEAGGNPYQRTCPPGFVATGIRGGHGRVVDGYRLVCTELL
jgi:hypothetical protein